jgi:dTDP-4-dehydrorhamnose reductase
MPSVWITGSGGLIGHALFQSAPDYLPGWEVIPLTRQKLDLLNIRLLVETFQTGPPDAVIHCAALSKSPACQADPRLARRTNLELTRILTDLAGEIPLILLSTDLVFDGQKGNYTEEDVVNPLSVYAETKALAEEVVLSNARHTVLRTSLNYGASPTGDRAFNEEMLLQWQAGQTLSLFTDEFRCPIPATTTARATWEVLRKGLAGLFHVAGSERLSRWQIGEALLALTPQYRAQMKPASLTSYAGASRPPDTSLNCRKLQDVLSFELPRFTDCLKAPSRM